MLGPRLVRTEWETVDGLRAEIVAAGSLSGKRDIEAISRAAATTGDGGAC